MGPPPEAPSGPLGQVLASLELSPGKAGLGVAPFLRGARQEAAGPASHRPPSVGGLAETGLWAGAPTAVAPDHGLREPYLVETRSDGGRSDENDKRRELGGSQDLQRLRTKHTGDSDQGPTGVAVTRVCTKSHSWTGLGLKIWQGGRTFTSCLSNSSVAFPSQGWTTATSK